MRAEHLKLLLQDIPAQELLAHAFGPGLRARPSGRRRWQARLMADGGVRGDAFRRLIARALAKQWRTFLKAYAPHHQRVRPHPQHQPHILTSQTLCSPPPAPRAP